MNFHLHRSRSIRSISALITFTAFSWACCLRLCAQTAAPQIKIDAGTLQGSWVASAPHVAAFLGIPYAAQPVGNLRWKAPQPPPTWSGIREATKYGPACPQTPSPWLPEMLGIQKMETNEACLYLNVWTPNLRGTAKTARHGVGARWRKRGGLRGMAAVGFDSRSGRCGCREPELSSGSLRIFRISSACR